MPDTSPLVEMAVDEQSRLAKALVEMARQKRSTASALVADADALERAAAALSALAGQRPRWDTVAPAEIESAVAVPPAAAPAPVPTPPDPPLPPRDPKPPRQHDGHTRALILRILGDRGEMTTLEIAKHCPVSLQGVGAVLRDLHKSEKVERRGPLRGAGVTWCLPGSSASQPSPSAPTRSATSAPPVPAGNAEQIVLGALVEAREAGLMPTPLRDRTALEVEPFSRLITALIERKLIARIVAGGIRYIILPAGKVYFEQQSREEPSHDER